MDWMNVLKTQQVNIGSTRLDTRELPDDAEDCCQQMKDFFIANIEILDIDTFGSYNGSWDYILDMDCEIFIKNAKHQYDGMRIIDDYSRTMKGIFGDSLLTYKWCNERTEN